MQIPAISLGFQIAEISPLIENGFLKKIQALSNNGFRFRVYNKEGTSDLIVLSNALFITSYKIPAVEENKGFVEFLKSRITGKKILALRQIQSDRIVILEFNEFDLVFELFGNGNIILVDKNHVCAGCLHREEWKDRKTWPKQPYQFPNTKPLPTQDTPEDFHHKLVSSEKNLITTLIFQYNLFPLIAEEACLKAKLENVPARELTTAKSQQLYDALLELEGQKKDPVIVTWKNEPLLLPFPLSAVFEKNKMHPESVKSFNEPVDAFFSPAFSDSIAAQKAHETVSTRSKGLQKSLKELEESEQKFKTAVKENHEKAEWVFRHYGELTDLFNALRTAEQKKMNEKIVLEKLSSFPHGLSRHVREVNLKTRKVVIEL